MYLILQLKPHLADSQTLSRDLLIVCQMLGYCQLPVCIFLTLRTGSAVHYNLSEKRDMVKHELRVAGYKLRVTSSKLKSTT